MKTTGVLGSTGAGVGKMLDGGRGGDVWGVARDVVVTRFALVAVGRRNRSSALC